MFQLLRILGHTLALGMYVVTYLVLTAMGLFLLTPWGWALLPAATALCVGLRRQQRRRRGDAVADYLAQAVGLNLPLAEAIEAAAEAEQGQFKRTLLNLAEKLHRGVGLGEAVDQTVHELPRVQRSVILAGERAGRPAAALDRVVRARRTQADAELFIPGVLWGYPLAIACLMGMVAVVILPKYEEVFADFDVAMPAMTTTLIDISRWLAGHRGTRQVVPGLFWVLLGVLVTGVTVGAGVMGFESRGSWVARAAWWMPVFGRLVRARAWSEASFVMGQSIEAGMPLDEALSEAAKLRINPVAAGRLRAWAREVRAGRSLHDGAAAAGLPDLITGTLAAAQTSADHTAAALGFLARHYELQASWLAALARGAAGPAMVVVLAVVVGWLAVALVMPLVTLIESMIPAAQGLDV